MTITSYAGLAAFITKVLTDNHQINSVRNAPHKDFWNTMSYQDFTTGNVPNVTDGGNPLRILIPGNSQASTIVHALQGTGIFDPNTGSQDRMPANGPPFFTDAQIQEIAGWIDANCPQ